MTGPPPSPSSPVAAIDRLSDRQRQCLELAATGLTSSGIGLRLGLSPRTVDEHLALACEALGVRTRIQAVARMAGDLRRSNDYPGLRP